MITKKVIETKPLSSSTPGCYGCYYVKTGKCPGDCMEPDMEKDSCTYYIYLDVEEA